MVQESNQQLTGNLNDANKELETLRAEVAKKAKKRAKSQRSVCTQCELSYLEDEAPPQSQAHAFTQDHSRIPGADIRSLGRHGIPAATMEHGWGTMSTSTHGAKVAPSVTRHTASQVRHTSLLSVARLPGRVLLTQKRVRKHAVHGSLLHSCILADAMVMPSWVKASAAAVSRHHRANRHSCPDTAP